MISSALKKIWDDLGIEKGDTVLIHSNIRPLLRHFFKKNIKLTPEDILDSLLIRISNSGNLIFPAFNFEVNKNKIFSKLMTKSEMGMLSEAARIHVDSVRTNHPVYSFSCFGDLSKELVALKNYTAYGLDSPFQYLREKNLKILVLNLSENDSMTYYHHVEEVIGVKYRYSKHFSADFYDDDDKLIGKREYSIYVRNLEANIITNVEPMGNILLQNKEYTCCSYGDVIKARVVKAKDLFNATRDVIKEGKALGLLYEIGN